MNNAKHKLAAGLLAFALLSASAVYAQAPQQATLKEGTRISLRLNDPLSTKTSREGDAFTAEVANPVVSEGVVVIPAGSVVSGHLTHVRKTPAHIDARFEMLALPNGTQQPISAQLAGLDEFARGGVDDEGSVNGKGSKKQTAAAVITLGAAGAGIGAAAGGGKGAAIGGGTGALIGLAAGWANRAKGVGLARGAGLAIVLDRPLLLSVDRSNAAQGSLGVASHAPPSDQPKRLNILLADNGGQVLLAPDDTWSRTIDGSGDGIAGNGDRSSFSLGQEAVYAFKDERAATFDTFGTLIPFVHRANLKEFELLVANDSPNGTFRSIGKFQIANAKMMSTGGWQDFKFSPVTARYLKVRLISQWEMSGAALFDGVRLFEFRLVGEPLQDAASQTTQASQITQAPPSDEPKRLNILLADNGGQVLLAPDDSWAQTIDGKGDGIAGNGDRSSFSLGQEAVYAFKDERAATFDTFGTLIPFVHRANLKEFELLVANDSPNGTFRSIGKFQIANAKMMSTGGWQDFKFSPVTARYLKVRLISQWEMSGAALFDGVRLFEFRLVGELQKRETL